MSDSNFTTAILETEVVVKHAENGHVYYFPIQSNGTVSLRAMANNMIVTAENAGASSLIANRTAIGTWEQFTLIADN